MNKELATSKGVVTKSAYKKYADYYDRLEKAIKVSKTSKGSGWYCSMVMYRVTKDYYSYSGGEVNKKAKNKLAVVQSLTLVKDDKGNQIAPVQNKTAYKSLNAYDSVNKSSEKGDMQNYNKFVSAKKAGTALCKSLKPASLFFDRGNLSLIYGWIYSIFASRCIRRNRPCRQLRK